jgi:hypothetical protein
MKAVPTNKIGASVLTQMLGMSGPDLRRLADERCLPMFFDTYGWGISRTDLEIWKTAALLAANEKENAA